MDKLKKEVEQTLKDLKILTHHYDSASWINEGWIEALEYVLNRIKMNEEEEE